MPTLYHAPDNRSDSIVTLTRLMGIRDRLDIVAVTIPRQDGSGARDPKNPHPEGKVPYLVDGDDHVRERGDHPASDRPLSRKRAWPPGGPSAAP